MRGKKSPTATPISAFAARTCCSASRTSGRRSSKLEGSPTGISTGISCASRVEVRSTGPGLRPRSVLISSSLRAIWRSISGMVAVTERSASSARETSSLDARPAACWSLKSLMSARRNPWCAGQSQAGRPVPATRNRPRATPLTTEIMTSRRPSCEAMKFARAASFIRRTRPQRSISQSTSKPAR